MPLFGELFLSEVIKKPVFDPKGEVVGKVKDLTVVKGDPLPRIAGLVVDRKGRQLLVKWEELNLFNKRIISTYVSASLLAPYQPAEGDLLALRDILDKQIVDIDGAKVVRVNDIRLEGYNSHAVLVAVDVGMRGIMRRLGVERGSENILRLLKANLPLNLIGWNYLQPLTSELKAIALTVPRQMVAELHPADLADIISQVPRDEGAEFFNDLDIETAADALSELKPEKQAEIISSIEPEKAADIIEEMPPDDAADVLSDLPAEKAKEILEHIEKEEAEDIQELLSHEEDTAGGLMTNEFIAFPPHITIQEAIERFRREAKEMDKIYYVYITDESERLIGATSLREILLEEPTTLLTDMMHDKLKTVLPDADEMVVAEMFSKYNLVAIPVVDEEGTLLGVVTIDDIIDLILPPAAKRHRKKL
jgi:CBS domain-containing protein